MSRSTCALAILALVVVASVEDASGQAGGRGGSPVPQAADDRSDAGFLGPTTSGEAGFYGLARSRASQASKTAIHDEVGEFGYPDANACPPS
jgi:hypothetical protein